MRDLEIQLSILDELKQTMGRLALDQKLKARNELHDQRSTNLDQNAGDDNGLDERQQSEQQHELAEDSDGGPAY